MSYLISPPTHTLHTNMYTDLQLQLCCLRDEEGAELHAYTTASDHQEYSQLSHNMLQHHLHLSCQWQDHQMTSNSCKIQCSSPTEQCSLRLQQLGQYTVLTCCARVINISSPKPWCLLQFPLNKENGTLPGNYAALLT